MAGAAFQVVVDRYLSIGGRVVRGSKRSLMLRRNFASHD